LQERVKDISTVTVDSVTNKIASGTISKDLRTYNVDTLTAKEREELEAVGVEVSETGQIAVDVGELIAAESVRRSDVFQNFQAANDTASTREEKATLRRTARARIRKLDVTVKALDERIDAILETIEARKKNDQPVKRLNNLVDKLLIAREKLDQERANLLTAETPIAQRREGLNATDKTVELKGIELLRAQRRVEKARERGINKGFREGMRLAKKDVKAAQKAVIDLLNSRVFDSGEQALDARDEIEETDKDKKKKTPKPPAAGFKLSPADRAKFINTLKNIQNAEQFAKAVIKIQNRITKLIAKDRARKAKKRLGKLLRSTRVKGNRGRFGPEVQELLDVARKAFALKPEEALERLQQRADAGTQDIPSPLEALENQILVLIAAPENLNVDQLEHLVESVAGAMELGRAIRKGDILGRVEESKALREELVDLMGPERDETDRQRRNREWWTAVEVKGLMGMSMAWWNKIKRIMPSPDAARVDALVDKLTLFDESRAFDRGKAGSVKRFTELILAALNTTSERAAWKRLARDEIDNLNMGSFRHSDGVVRNLDIQTRAQLRKRIMELKDDALRESMMSPKGNAYTDEIIQALEDQMTEEDYRLVDAQLQFYEEYYVRINEVYERVHGFSLPKLTFYSPIKRMMQEETQDEFMKGILYRGGVAPGSLKSRKPSIRPLHAIGDLTALHSHVMEMEYFIAYAEKVQQLNHVFGNPEIQTRILRKFGKNILKTINNDLDYFSKRGVRNSIIGEQIFQTLMRNFSFAQLGAKPQIGLKQLASFAAYSENVKTRDFIEGLVVFFGNPRRALRILRDSELFRERGINIDQDYQALLADKSWFNVVGRRPTLARILMIPIRFGDKGAIAIGGYAHYHAKLKQAGVTKQQALDSFQRLTVRTQQSTDIDQLSELQRTSAFIRVMTQFMSSANALTRAEYNAVLDRRAGRISRKEFAKRILVLHVLIPGTIQFITNGFTWDDEDQLRASLLGTLNGIFIIGDALEALFRLFIQGEEEVFDLESRHPLSFFSDITSALADLKENGFEFEDLIEGSKLVDHSLKAGGALTGVPIQTLVNELRGLHQLGTSRQDDEAIAGFLRMLGYSSYTIDEKVLAP